MGDVYMNVMQVRKRRCSCDEALVADRQAHVGAMRGKGSLASRPWVDGSAKSIAIAHRCIRLTRIPKQHMRRLPAAAYSNTQLLLLPSVSLPPTHVCLFRLVHLPALPLPSPAASCKQAQQYHPHSTSLTRPYGAHDFISTN
jgi:hypothetical protein